MTKEVLIELLKHIGIEDPIEVQTLVEFTENMILTEHHKLFEKVASFRDKQNDILPADQTILRDLRFDVATIYEHKINQLKEINLQIDAEANQMTIDLKSEKIEKMNVKGQVTGSDYKYVDIVIKAKIGQATYELQKRKILLETEIAELKRYLDYIVDTVYAIAALNKIDRDLYH